MKRFDFKLEPLLNFRKYLELLSQQMTAKAHLDLNNCENQIALLKEKYLSASDDLEKHMVKGINAKDFKQHHHFLGNIENDIENQLRSKIELKKVLEKKIAELKKRSVDKKVIEVLKDKRQKEYNDEIIKQDQKILDEISSQKKSRDIAK